MHDPHIALQRTVSSSIPPNRIILAYDLPTYLPTYLLTYLPIYPPTYIHACIHTYVHSPIHMHTHIQMHIHTHSYIHTKFLKAEGRYRDALEMLRGVRKRFQRGGGGMEEDE